MKMTKILPAIVAGLGLAVASSQASLIVYESFDYANGTVAPDADASSGQANGLPYTNVGGSPSGTGTGMRNTWLSGTATTGSLSYTGALPSTNNSLSISAAANITGNTWVYRGMTTDPYASYRSGGNALGASGTTLYGSMLLSMSGIASGDRFWLRLSGDNNPGAFNDIVLYTANGGNWSVTQYNTSSGSPSGTSLTINSAVAATTATSLIVWQQDFTASNTVTSFWINNTNTSGAANYVFTSNGTVNFGNIGYRNGNNSSVIDELRIGTTMLDVVPEPTTWALLAGSLTALAVYRRRNRQS